MEKTAEGIPTDRASAIQAIVEQDVTKWGESEREASYRIHKAKTYGLALNTLACRAAEAGRPAAKELRMAANAALTPDDWADLREAG